MDWGWGEQKKRGTRAWRGVEGGKRRQEEEGEAMQGGRGGLAFGRMRREERGKEEREKARREGQKGGNGGEERG